MGVFQDNGNVITLGGIWASPIVILGEGYSSHTKITVESGPSGQNGRNLGSKFKGGQAPVSLGFLSALIVGR